MRLLLSLIFLISIKVHSNEKILAGKSLICAYGKNKDVYEVYLFFNKYFISNFLFLENHKFRIRENEKKTYSLSSDFINILPFKIHRKSLEVIDIEYDKIIGSCQLSPTHKQAINFMKDFKKRSQEIYNNNLDALEA